MSRRTPLLLSQAVFLCTLLTTATSAQEVVHSFVGGAAGLARGPTSVAGDLDGDGIADLIVGAPDAGTYGEAHVIAGADGDKLFVLHSPVPAERFGAEVAAIGDANGDGIPDLVVGGPGDAGSSAAGVVALFSGADGELLWALQGSSPGDRLGASLASIGDIDGDDLADLAIGAPGSDVNGTDAGQVLFVSGADGAILSADSGDEGDQYGSSASSEPPTGYQDEPIIVIGATMDESGGAGYVRWRSLSDGSSMRLDGLASGQRFGHAVALLGDVDGDGRDDFAVGSDPRDAQGASTAAGTVTIHSGADGALIHTLTGGLPGSGFALELAALGDVDGDGVADLAIGEPGHDAGQADVGALHVVSGATGDTLHVIEGSGSGQRLGSHVAHAGDLDGDDLADVAVTTAAGDVTLISFTPWDKVSNGVAGSYGVPQLDGRGGLKVGSEVVLQVSAARAMSTAALVMGSALVLDVAHGTLGPVPEVVLSLVTDVEGQASHTEVWPEDQASGATVYYQVRVVDPEAPLGLALSNTLAAVAP